VRVDDRGRSEWIVLDSLSERNNRRVESVNANSDLIIVFPTILIKRRFTLSCSLAHAIILPYIVRSQIYMV
jgi:hypothetical protein